MDFLVNLNLLVLILIMKFHFTDLQETEAILIFHRI